MLEAKLLNSSAELNNFFELDALSYTPGENVTIVVRLFDKQKGIRLIPTDAGAEVKLTFTGKTADFTKDAAKVDAADASMWSVTLSAAETADLAGSNIKVELDEAGDDVSIKLAIIFNALSRQVLSGDC